MTTEKLREHYKNFFWPNNAEAILVGDFDEAKALAMFDREFGSFSRSSKPIPQVITQEPAQEGERRVTVRRTGKRRASRDCVHAAATPCIRISFPSMFSQPSLAVA